MAKLFLQSGIYVLLLAALGGCSYLGIGAPASQTEKTNVEAPDLTTGADAEITDAETEEIVQPPFLTYDWTTGFSGFLSPPIEVRRAAKADCVSEGYQVAVIEVLALHGEVATGTFICRGDTE